MSKYSEQAADRVAALLQRGAEAGIEPPEWLRLGDASTLAEQAAAEVARREAGLATQLTPRTERLPYTGRTERAGRIICRPGCECVACRRPSKDLGERVVTTGRVGPPTSAQRREAESLLASERAERAMLARAEEAEARARKAARVAAWRKRHGR